MKKTIILGSVLVLAVFVWAWIKGVFWWLVLIAVVQFFYSWWLHRWTWNRFEAEQNRRTLARLAERREHPAAKIPVHEMSELEKTVAWVNKQSGPPKLKTSLFNKPSHGK